MEPSQSEIRKTCTLIRRWNENFAANIAWVPETAEATTELAEAVAALKHYLEGERADGKPIRELAISSYLLATREGIRWVMPFVLSAESIEACKHGGTTD